MSSDHWIDDTFDLIYPEEEERREVCSESRQIHWKEHTEAKVFHQEQEERPDIFKLNADSFKKWFEWLSLGELRALRQTCKQMKHIVDNYIILNYPLVLRRLYIHDDELKHFFHAKADDFEFVNHLNITKLRVDKIDGFGKANLGQVQSIRISTERFDGDLYEDLLKFCTSLKYLHVKIMHHELIAGEKSEWLQKKYPNLEHFSLFLENGMKCDGLRTFFERNANIRIFSTRLKSLWMIRDWILESDLKFEQLDVVIDTFSDITPDDTSNYLIKLHEHGFYQRLHIYAPASGDSTRYSYIHSLRALERLTVGYNYNEWVYGRISLQITTPLIDVKELFIDHTLHWTSEDLDTLATNIMNVQNIS